MRMEAEPARKAKRRVGGSSLWCSSTPASSAVWDLLSLRRCRQKHPPPSMFLLPWHLRSAACRRDDSGFPSRSFSLKRFCNSSSAQQGEGGGKRRERCCSVKCVQRGCSDWGGGGGGESTAAGCVHAAVCGSLSRSQSGIPLLFQWHHLRVMSPLGCLSFFFLFFLHAAAALWFVALAKGIAHVTPAEVNATPHSHKLIHNVRLTSPSDDYEVLQLWACVSPHDDVS